jgi:hypothetical protein
MKNIRAYMFAFLALLNLSLSVACDGQPAHRLGSISDILYITLEEDSDHVRVTAQKDRHEARTERIDKGEFRKRSLILYKALDSRRLSDAAGQRMIEKLGGQVLGPFRPLIQSADEIVFVVSDELLETPIDLLHHLGKPLFLQMPVSYRVSPYLEKDSVFYLPYHFPDGWAGILFW